MRTLDESRPAPSPAASRDTSFVAPRSPTEHQIATIWEELFGVSPIGANDNYFDLGGDSLLAATFASRIDATFGIVLSASVLLEAPTVAKLAAAMDRAEYGVKEPLTALRASGRRSPIFFLHNDYGRGLYTHALARCLDSEHPFYAVHLHGLREPERPTTVEAIAASRIQAMRAARRHGPYVLGGHCQGALIALEMARQLRDAGEHVELVVMVDPPAPSRGFRILRHSSNVLAWVRGHFDGVWKAVQWRTRYYQSRIGLLRRASVRAQTDYELRKLTGVAQPLAAAQVGPPARGDGMPDPSVGPDFTASRRVQRRAIQRYVPSSYAGRVVLFRAEQLPAYRPDLGWSRLLPRLEVAVIPGDHHSCITRHVATFGARLNEALRRANPATQFTVSHAESK